MQIQMTRVRDRTFPGGIKQEVALWQMQKLRSWLPSCWIIVVCNIYIHTYISSWRKFCIINLDDYHDLKPLKERENYYCSSSSSNGLIIYFTHHLLFTEKRERKLKINSQIHLQLDNIFISKYTFFLIFLSPLNIPKR